MVSNMKNTKILYFHPALRSYRKPLFESLASKMNIRFLWTERVESQNQHHILAENKKLMHSAKLSAFQAQECTRLPFRGFSFDLFLTVFEDFDCYIFSNIVSVPFLLLGPFLRLKKKKILLFDEMWRYPKEVWKYKLIYFYVKFLSRYCIDGVIVAGSKAKAFYIETLKFDESQIEIAYNTTNDVKLIAPKKIFYNHIDLALKTITVKKKILYLGRIVEYKGLDILIHAMSEIDEAYDLIVVGEGPFEKECQDLTKKLELEKRVYFMGPCLSHESIFYYRHADLFVLPARYHLNSNVQCESWGFTINEAMSAEVCVVATTAVGAAYDLVIENYTGGIAEAGDIQNLAFVINNILAVNINNCLGKNARKHVLKTCNYEENLSAYVRAIEKATVNEK